MSIENPEFVKCAMEAFEEGVRAGDIREECACRLGLTFKTNDIQTKE